jgi:pimeloyl-ACP methyl ester carboxylesterase
LDATRGLRDFADDIYGVVKAKGWEQYHFLGHSLGGSIGYSYLLDHSEEVLSATLIAPGSPYGFGGTKDVNGTPCYEDFAGTGGGLRNEDYLRMMRENYRKADNMMAPLSRLRATVFKPPFIHPREDAILDALNATHQSDDNYPGNFVASPNWPMLGPGDRGVNNALSPKYDKGYEIVDLDQKPPILWIRGADDLIVSNQSLADMGTLGKMGLIPGWPGEDVFPPQPMLEQTRAVLEDYQAKGGEYTEEVFADCGHSPQAEKFDEFMPLFEAFVSKHQT